MESTTQGSGGLIGQVARFGVVGALAFLIDYGTLMVLSQLVGIDPVPSAAISFTVSVVFNYLASMRFVFTHRDDMTPARELAIFVVLSLVGLALNELIMVVGTTLAGTGPVAVTVTKVIATALVMLWNFCSRKRWLDAS